MRIHLIVLSMVPTLLCACGGGGGDSSVVRPVAFTSFSNVMPGQTVQASGMSQTENLIQDSSGVVTATGMNAGDTNTSSATWTYSASSPLTLTALSINAPHSSITWTNGRGAQTVSCSGATCSAAGEGARGVMINALDSSVAWNYQTFGYWLTDGSTTTNVAGAISVGNPTPVGNVPIGGTASYVGLSGGSYVDAAGTLSQQTAIMAAGVDFGTRNVNFSTSGSTIRPWGSTAVGTSAPQLNMTGATLSYAAGTNQFTGAVTTPGMTGTVTGRFYGPGAEEIGGTYTLTNGAIESMTGAFGGKR